MRTTYRSVSSARRISAWLVAALGLAAYVGLIYGLTVFPVQFELPVPYWATLVVPAAVYGLLILAFVRRPSVLRWIVGTAVLMGLHVLLGIAREPLTTMLDPALAGRPLPWTLPPPFPELVGLCLLLVPLRDLLRPRPRLARERTSSAGRVSSGYRTRGVVVPRVPQAAPPEVVNSAKEIPVWERSAAPEPVEAPAAMPAPVSMTPSAPVGLPAAGPDDSRRRGAARRESRPEPVRRPPGHPEVVLRIALDRIMGQLPPGTFLAPEDEVAASLRDPGHLLIPGELVVTQLSEGVARIAWGDVVDQFPSHLVGLSREEISDHLGGEGLRLPLDEVVGQLPHELFVADTPEVEMAGLDRIPVPFQPMEDSTPAPSLSRAAAYDVRPVPIVEQPRSEPTPVAPEPPPTPAVVPPAVETRTVVSAPVAPVPSAPAAPRRVEVPRPSTPSPARASEPSVAAAAPSSPIANGPTVLISFARIASELPAEAFNAPLDEVAERMQQPGALVIPQALVLPQLAEGLIRVKWDVVASQFPRQTLTVSDADVTARLPNGISLPLDEVIRQIPPDLFVIGGPTVDLHGLESFPAPFQPLVSDPEPPTPKAGTVDPPVAPVAAMPAPEPQPAVGPVSVTPPTPVAAGAVATATADAVVQEAPVSEPTAPEKGVSHRSVAETPRTEGPSVPAPPLITPEPTPEPVSIVVPESSEPRALEPDVTARPVEATVSVGPEPLAEETPKPPVGIDLPRAERSWRDLEHPAPAAAVGTAATAEAAEARRIAAMLAPIASFEASAQSMEGVTVFSMAAPALAPETAVAGAGLALPLFTDRRAPGSLDQVTFRGPETALVLTALGGPSDRGPVLAAAIPRGGGLALLEILCRRAAGDRSPGAGPGPTADGPSGGRGLVPSSPELLAGLTSSLTAFGDVTATALHDPGGEGIFYLFLPVAADVPGVGALAQDVQAIMRKAAGSGTVFRTSVLRSGRMLLVIQPEELAHGRSIIVVAGGEVSRPGLAYRQVERVTSALSRA